MSFEWASRRHWLFEHWPRFADLAWGVAPSPGYRHALARQYARPDLSYGLDVWRDTSTLYVRIFNGHLPPGIDDGSVLAAGVITIHIPDFMKQLTTFRTWGESRIGAMEGFGRLFLGQLWDVYGRFFREDPSNEQRDEERSQ